MPAFIPIAMALYSAYQGIKSAEDRKKAQADAQRSLNQRPTYQTPPELKEQLNDARAMRNAVNPALLMAYQQAQQQAAGQVANAQRNATSGAEALSAGASAQSNLQSFLPQLAQAQTAYEQANRGQYYNALQGMAEDARFKQQDAVAANADRTNYNIGLAGAARAGQNQAVQSLATIATSPYASQGNNGLGNYMSFLARSRAPMQSLAGAGMQILPIGNAAAPAIYPTYNPNWFMNQNAGMYGG